MSEKGKILVTVELDADRCFGDVESGVRPIPPLTPENRAEKEDQLSPYLRVALDLGLIVFFTQADDYMFHAPEPLDAKEAEKQLLISKKAFYDKIIALGKTPFSQH